MEHEVDDGVLKHFCVDFHGWHVRVASEGEEDSVGCCTHTALEWEESWGDDAALLLVHEEVGHVFSYLVCDWVGVLECACFVGDVALYHSHDFVRFKLEIGCADAVGHLLYHDRLAHRWVERFIYVMNADRLWRVEGVKFEDYSLFC